MHPYTHIYRSQSHQKGPSRNAVCPNLMHRIVLVSPCCSQCCRRRCCYFCCCCCCFSSRVSVSCLDASPSITLTPGWCTFPALSHRVASSLQGLLASRHQARLVLLRGGWGRSMVRQKDKRLETNMCRNAGGNTHLCARPAKTKGQLVCKQLSETQHQTIDKGEEQVDGGAA